MNTSVSDHHTLSPSGESEIQLAHINHQPFQLELISCSALCFSSHSHTKSAFFLIYICPSSPSMPSTAPQVRSAVFYLYLRALVTLHLRECSAEFRNPPSSVSNVILWSDSHLATCVYFQLVRSWEEERPSLLSLSVYCWVHNVSMK